MSDIILHHYPRSPFAEKVRLALGLKGLSYGSVIVPAWMPKPDLMPLTGGYRRTPVMQVGADVFCDTLLILQQIERMHPSPSLYPHGTDGLATALGWWVEKSTFIPAIGLARGLAELPSRPELLEDRRAFFGFGIEKEIMQPQQTLFLQRLVAHLSWLGQILRDGRDFLLGADPSAADLAAYHPLWFIRTNCGPEVDRLLPQLSDLLAWFRRVEAIGHGTPSELAAADALAVAAKAQPAAVDETAAVPVPGCVLGARVGVTPDDSGRDTVTGTLIAASAQSVVLRRLDPALGEINVHFPRAGFDVAPA